MNHDLKLYDESFKKLVPKEKDIEVRLYDEKRKQIQVNDTITFINIETGEKRTLKVIRLVVFSNFKNLFQNFQKKRFGHSKLTLQEQIKKIRQYYTETQEQQNGVIGIILATT